MKDRKVKNDKGEGEKGFYFQKLFVQTRIDMTV